MSETTTTPTPTEPHQDTLIAIVRALGVTYTPTGAAIWLRSSNAHLHQHRPIDLLAAGEFEPVVRAVEALGDVPDVLAAVSAAAPDEREALAKEHARVRRARVFDHHRYDDKPPQPDDYVAADVTLAALAARPAPTVNAADVEITTAAELDALPAGTIVRDRFGGYLAQGRDAMGVAWFHYPVYDHAGSSALVAGIGPVTVCFTPGLTVADERSRQPWRHDGHKPVQHRDGKAPWCDECGWSSPAGPFPAALLGEPRSTVADEGAER